MLSRCKHPVALGALPPLLAYLLSWYYDGQDILLLTGTALVLLLWAVSSGLERWRRGEARPTGFLPAFMLAWFVWYAMTLLWSPDPYTSWFYVWTLGALPLAFLGWTLATPTDPERADRIWRQFRFGVFLSALVLAGLAMYQYWHWTRIGMSPAGLRPYGPLLDTNSFAAWMNLLFFPVLFVWFLKDESVVENRTGRGWAWALFGLLALILLADFSTDSRGGLLSWLCTWPFAIWALYRRPRVWRKLATVGLAALAAFSVFQWSRGFDLVGHLAPSFIDHNISTVSRWLMWKATWHMYLAHPWGGVGLGGYFLFYPAFRLPAELASAGTYAHNDYLQFLAEGGPLNLAFLLAFAAILFWAAWKLIRMGATSPARSIAEYPRLEAVGLVLGVFAITGHALGNFIFYNLPLSLLAGLFLARAWMVLAPPASSPQTGIPTIGRQRLAAVLVALLLAWPVADLLCDTAGVTLMNGTWVGAYLPNAWRFPVLFRTAELLSVIRSLDPAPHLLLAGLYRQSAKLPTLTAAQRRLQLDSALVQYHAALEGIPREASVLNAIAALIAKHGPALGLSPAATDKAAVGYWRQAIAVDPEDLAIRYDLATWLRLHSQYAAGRALLLRGGNRPLLGREPKILAAMIAAYPDGAPPGFRPRKGPGIPARP